MENNYPFHANADEFKNKRVLVTGGTKGAGEAMVRRFLLSGAKVATAARSSLSKDQRPTLFVQTDLGSSPGIQKLAERILGEWGGVDILVNCVGGSDAPNGGYAALTDEHWQEPACGCAMRQALPGGHDRAQSRCHSACGFHSTSAASI
jgi:NADPH:quinone reductase-like Zn-dependent oxidoreductase